MLNFTTFYRHAVARGVGSVFVLMGIIFGTWAAAIPSVKEKFGLDEGGLGLLLLCFPLGVTLMNPFAVLLLHRFGPKLATLGSLVSGAFLFILPVAMPNIWLTGAALVLAGLGLSATNITMNTCASNLERFAGLQIFSTCHGLWSTGAMLGSVMASSAVSLGAPRVAFAVGLAFAVLTLAFLLNKPLSQLPENKEVATENTPNKRKFSMPTGALWTLILISLCTNLTEGTMTDWSAVYMREIVGGTESRASLAFSVYAFFMAVGRFLGDGLIARFGSIAMLRAGGATVFVGLLLAVSLPVAWAVFLGFALVGAGISIGAPILYAAAAKVPGLPEGAGLATMNTFAMVGFLGGPAVIGILAKLSDLRLSFAMVAVFAAYWFWKSKQVR